jgi:hypothetical protein
MVMRDDVTGFRPGVPGRVRRAIGPWGLGAVAVVVAVACNAPAPVVGLTDGDCPEGAVVVGTAAAGGGQRCELPGGIRHGKSRAWHDNGRLRYETEWWQGKKHGRFTLWHANGRQRAEGHDRHGVPEGTWTSWAESGAVEQERTFHAPRMPEAASRVQ